MSKMILYGLLIYFLYKFIFNVVVPVGKGVSNIKQNMEQARASQAKRQSDFSQTNNAEPPSTPKTTVKPVDVEYIDFEELKKK